MHNNELNTNYHQLAVYATLARDNDHIRWTFEGFEKIYVNFIRDLSLSMRNWATLFELGEPSSIAPKEAFCVVMYEHKQCFCPCFFYSAKHNITGHGYMLME